MRHTSNISYGFIFTALIALLIILYPAFSANGKPGQQGLSQRVADLELLVETQSNALDALQDALACVDASSTDLDFVLDGCNVHIRNGATATQSANTLGNLIVGYNENTSLASRLGSHNIIVGADHAYDGVSGLVVGSSLVSLKVSNDDVRVKAGASTLELGTTDATIRSKDISLIANDSVVIKGATKVEVNSAVF